MSPCFTLNAQNLIILYIKGNLYLLTPFTYFTHLWQLPIYSLGLWASGFLFWGLLFFFFCLFCFLIPHISEIMQHLSLSVWFISLSVLKIHPCCCKWQDFFFLYDSVIFHCVYIQHFLYSLTHSLVNVEVVSMF